MALPKSFRFRQDREASWAELDRLVTRAEKRGIRSLTADELNTLPVLYRAAMSALSVARSISLDKNVADYLQSLCSRAYLVVYGTNRRLLASLGRFFSQTFPELVYQHRNAVLLAIAVTLLGTLAGFALVLSDWELFYTFVDRGLAGDRGPMSTHQELRAVLYSAKTDVDYLSYFSSQLFTHNTGVGFTCFALGVLGGVPTILLLLSNGLMLGAFWAIHYRQGLSWDMWLWMLPHGVTELLAIMLCGAAGLIVGGALIFPGKHRRLENLAHYGRRAGAIVAGTISLFFLAGLIEGIFRQVVQDQLARGALVLLTAVWWVWYFVIRGREAAR